MRAELKAKRKKTKTKKNAEQCRVREGNPMGGEESYGGKDEFWVKETAPAIPTVFFCADVTEYD